MEKKEVFQSPLFMPFPPSRFRPFVPPLFHQENELLHQVFSYQPRMEKKEVFQTASQSLLLSGSQPCSVSPQFSSTIRPALRSSSPLFLGSASPLTSPSSYDPLSKLQGQSQPLCGSQACEASAHPSPPIVLPFPLPCPLPTLQRIILSPNCEASRNRPMARRLVGVSAHPSPPTLALPSTPHYLLAPPTPHRPPHLQRMILAPTWIPVATALWLPGLVGASAHPSPPIVLPFPPLPTISWLPQHHTSLPTFGVGSSLPTWMPVATALALRLVKHQPHKFNPPPLVLPLPPTPCYFLACFPSPQRMILSLNSEASRNCSVARRLVKHPLSGVHTFLPFSLLVSPHPLPPSLSSQRMILSPNSEASRNRSVARRRSRLAAQESNFSFFAHDD
ncbi:unnamed protein product [Closterium sp. NIES-54]